MNNYVLSFKEIDKTKLPLAGGKDANLGELSRLSEIPVPDGFCVTTEAYKKTFGFLRRTTGHLFEHHRKESNPGTHQQMLGIAVHRESNNLPRSKPF